MVKIELMRIEPGTFFTEGSDQSLFKRLSSNSLFPNLPGPTPTTTTTSTSTAISGLTSNSVVTSSFLGLRRPFQRYKLLGGRPIYSGAGHTGSNLRMPKDQEEVVPITRLSLPCVHGCCYCVYGRLHGPVRVYFSRFTPDKDERKISGITDGNGNRVFPVSRKRDIKGLVYDHDTFSLHPPSTTERRFPRKHKTPRYRHATSHSNMTSAFKRVRSSPSRTTQGRDKR